MEKIPHNQKEIEPSKSLLQSVREKTSKKLLGLLAGLSLTASTQASTFESVDVKDNIQPKTEYVGENPEGTPKELTSQYEGSFEKFIQIDFTNYFETDNATLESENKTQIEKQFTDFLSTVDSKSIDDVLKSDFIIYSSCDERKSKAFKSNLDLSLARSESIRLVLENVLDTFDFSETNISSEKIEELKQKEFSFDYPSFPNAEAGVVPLESEYAIFGEDATKNMTKEELYALVRMTRFELRIPKSSLEKQNETPSVVEVKDKQQVFETLQNLLSKEKTNVLLFDKSGSMHNDIDALSSILKGYDDVLVGSFSNKFHGIVSIDDRVGIEKVMSGGSSTKERAIHSLQEFLNNYSQNNTAENLNIVIVTDEALQDISLLQVQTIEKETKEHDISVSLLFLGEKEIVASLEDIEGALLANPKYQKELLSTQKSLEDAKQKRDNAPSKDIKTLWEKTVKQLEDKISSLNVKSFTLPVSDFQEKNI